MTTTLPDAAPIAPIASAADAPDTPGRTGHCTVDEVLDLLAEELTGRLVRPLDPDWDDARRAWQLTVAQCPAAVVLPADAADVASCVGAARHAGLRVAMQGTGHNAAPLGDLDGTLLVRTSRLRDVRVDPHRRTVRVEAGAVWGEVVTAAAEHGLVALAGSSADVGVVGYTVGGGLSWLGRRFGLAATHVVAAEVVTADGRALAVDADREPDLFWALRGGGGSFAAVTALHLRLFPDPGLHAGALFFPLDRAETVLRTWRDLLPGLGDETTTCGRLLRLPPLPEIPEPLRGGRFVVVEVAHSGSSEGLDRVLAPLRALGPAIDTVAPSTPEDLLRLHMDPDGPVPAAGSGTLLAALPDGVLDGLLRVAGPEADSPLLSVELRHLGGALARVPEGAGGLATLEGQFALFAVGITPHPQAVRAVEAAVDAVLEVAAAWSGRAYANFAERRTAPERFFDAATLRRLRAVRDRYDPAGLFHANHPVTGGAR